MVRAGAKENSKINLFLCTANNFKSISKVLNGIGLTVNLEYQQFAHIAVAAIKELFHQPTDAFWTGRAMDLIFDGIEFDCDTTDPLAKLACNQIRKRKDPTIQPMEGNKLKFSLFGRVSLIISLVFINNFVILIIHPVQQYIERSMEVNSRTKECL